MRENTTKIRNIKQYLKAVLFNAPSTIDSYYTALVNHDILRQSMSIAAVYRERMIPFTNRLQKQSRSFWRSKAVNIDFSLKKVASCVFQRQGADYDRSVSRVFRKKLNRKSKENRQGARDMKQMN